MSALLFGTAGRGADGPGGLGGFPRRTGMSALLFGEAGRGAGVFGDFGTDLGLARGSGFKV